MSPAITPSRPLCSSPITQRWSWKGCGRRGRWNKSEIDLSKSEPRNLEITKSRLGFVFRVFVACFLVSWLRGLVFFRPVPRVFVQKRQRLERLHPIEEQ